MNLHSLKNEKGAKHRSIRLGRGRASGKGKTCGKGHKGQMSRSGHKRKPTFEGGQMRLVRRLPKRGFHNINRVEFVPVNLSDLQNMTEEAVSIDTMIKAGLANGKNVKIKILGSGKIERKVTVQAHAFSETARTKIEAAGGTCEVVK